EPWWAHPQPAPSSRGQFQRRARGWWDAPSPRTITEPTPTLHAPSGLARPAGLEEEEGTRVSGARVRRSDREHRAADRDPRTTRRNRYANQRSVPRHRRQKRRDLPRALRDERARGTPRHGSQQRRRDGSNPG